MNEVLEQLYINKYKDFMLISSRLIGGDMYGAEDVVQEAFARAYKYKNSFDPKYGTVTKWFNSILFHCANNFRKDEKYGGMSTEIKDGDLVVEDDFGHDKKMVEEINLELSGLKGANRQICFLYFVKQYKPREITQVTGIAGNSVRTAVKRFSQHIRSKYKC